MPNIDGANAVEINKFYERFMYDVQSLESMGKLSEVNWNAAWTIDKLSGIQGDLVRNDKNWQDWSFLQLCEALRSWTWRNPLEKNNRPEERPQERSS